MANYVLVSAEHASPKSLLFYSKMKGQLEEDVKALGFSKLIIFNPHLLIREKSDRKTAVFIAKLLNAFNSIGVLLSQKPLSTKTLALAMLKSVKTLKEGEHAIQGQRIAAFVEVSK